MILLFSTCGVIQEVTHSKEEGYTGSLIPIETVLRRLRIWESKNRQKYRYGEKRGQVKISPKGAMGVYQVMPTSGLVQFNTFNPWGLKYNTNDLMVKWKNIKVGRWIFFNNLSNKTLMRQEYVDRMVLAVSAYNQGIGNTWAGKVYWTFASNVCREYWPWFISRRIIIKQGTKVMRLWSLDPAPKDDL